MTRLLLTANNRSTYVNLVHGINAVGERYTCPTRRMRDALRRVRAKSIDEVRHDAAQVFRFHGGYCVRFND